MSRAEPVHRPAEREVAGLDGERRTVTGGVSQELGRPGQDDAGRDAEPLDRACLDGGQREPLVREQDRERTLADLGAQAGEPGDQLVGERRRELGGRDQQVGPVDVRQDRKDVVAVLADEVDDGEPGVLAEPAQRLAEAERLDALQEAAVGRQADRHEAGRAETEGRHPHRPVRAGPDVRQAGRALAAGQRGRLPLRPVDQQDALAGRGGDGGGDVGGDQAADQRGQPPDDRDDLSASDVGRLLIGPGEPADQHPARG